MKDVLPFVTIAIITYNVKRTLRQCLESVFKLDYPRNKYEVIIVDAGSKDDTLDIARDFPVEKIIIEDECTRGRGRNICIQEARGEIIAMVDADEILPKDWLKHVVRYFEDSQVAHVAGAASTYKTPVPKNLGKIGTVIYFFECRPSSVLLRKD